LQNASYWSTYKSEFDIYEAEMVRDSQARKCEVLMIFTPHFVDSDASPYFLYSKEPGPIPVIEMYESATIPHGIITEQLSIRAFWRLDFISLARISTAGTDEVGQITKSLTENRTADNVSWHYVADTYRGKIDHPDMARPNDPAFVEDELPLRVRTLDFSKSSGAVDLRLAHLEGAQPELHFDPAKLVWKTNEKTIEIDVKRDRGTDHFILDRDFPFLLREWQMAAGSRLRMKNSLRVDHRNYLKNGDRERALKDPMLRHPD
jgi:hypothetical protein